MSRKLPYSFRNGIICCWGPGASSDGHGPGSTSGDTGAGVGGDSSGSTGDSGNSGAADAAASMGSFATQNGIGLSDSSSGFFGGLTSENIGKVAFGLLGFLAAGVAGASLGVKAGGIIGGMFSDDAVASISTNPSPGNISANLGVSSAEAQAMSGELSGMTEGERTEAFNTANNYYGANIGTTTSGNTAADTAASYQQQALDYLQEREAIPQQFREGALQSLGGLYGLEGGTGNQQELIDQAKNSPLYSSIMGGQQAGEEAIMRNASATGGLRSGNVQSNMYEYNTQLQNTALLESYNQQVSGLSGLAGLSSNDTAIADAMTGIGETYASGITAENQMAADSDAANAAEKQQNIDNWMGFGNFALTAIDSFL